MKHLKYMHANKSSMDIYDYNHTQNKMIDTKIKAIQHIKIEDIAFNNTIGFESNTLKHSFFDETAIIQNQYCLALGHRLWLYWKKI